MQPATIPTRVRPSSAYHPGTRIARRLRRTAVDPVVALWAVYFGMAPVAWLPGVPVPVVSLAKTALFVVAVVAVWASSRPPRLLPRGVLGPLGLVALALSASFAAFLASDDQAVIVNYYQIALAFVTLWTFFVYRRSGRDIFAAVVPAAYLQAALTVPIVLGHLGLLGGLNAPASLGGLPIWESGFAIARNPWSTSVAFSMPFVAGAAIGSSGARRYRLMGVGALLFAGQLVVASRAGLALTFIGLGIFVLAVGGRRTLLATALVAAILLPFGATISNHLRLDRLQRVDLTTLERLDVASSRRISLYREGYSRFLEDPARGQGFGNDSLTLVDNAIVHSTWLRLGIAGGILFPLTLGVVVATILLGAVPWARRVKRWAGFAVLAGGVAMSFVQVGALIGLFHVWTIWWACAGYFATRSSDRSSVLRRPAPRWQAT